MKNDNGVERIEAVAEATGNRAAGDAVFNDNDVREWPLRPSVDPSVGLHGKTLSQQYRIEKPLGGSRRAYELGIDSPNGSRP